MWNKTKFTKLAGIQYPIVQGPFGGGISSVLLTSVVSNAGGLGSYGCQPLSAAEIVDTCGEIRKLTDKPFNINLWVSDRDTALAKFDTAAYDKLAKLLQPYFEEIGVELPLAPPTDLGPSFENQIDAIFQARPAVFSFVYGIPRADILDKCRSLGIKTIGAATTVQEAIALENAGIDGVVVTGLEAGGHRVSFLKPAEESLTGLFALIPQVADKLKLPIVAAGGIADGRGIKAALTLGAHAAQLGTAFLATSQSNATQEHKDKLFTKEAEDTTLTRVFTGRLSRGLRNRLTEELKGSDSLLAPYPLQGKLMSIMRSYPATDSSHVSFKSYWAGQSAALLKYKDAQQLMEALVTEMNAEGV